MKGKYPNGVAAALERAAMTQGDLARAVGESRQQISRWASGSRKLTPEAAEKIAKATGLTPGRVFAADEEPEWTKRSLIQALKSLSPEELGEVLAAAMRERERDQRDD